MSDSWTPPERDPKEIEKLLVSELLKNVGVESPQIEARERPDFAVRWSDQHGVHVVGIEVTEYQIDRGKNGGSLARAISDLEKRVISVAQPLCIDAISEFRSLEVHVTLKRSGFPRKRDIAAIGRQLADYLISQKQQIDERIKPLDPRTADAKRFPLIRTHIDSIRAHLTRLDRPLWHHGGAAHIGIVESAIVDILRQKARARKGYDCRGLDACWLVVAASGVTRHDGAGPMEHCQDRLHSPQVLAAASAAGFDRVYFWEGVRGWHELLCP